MFLEAAALFGALDRYYISEKQRSLSKQGQKRQSPVLNGSEFGRPGSATSGVLYRPRLALDPGTLICFIALYLLERLE